MHEQILYSKFGSFLKPKSGSQIHLWLYNINVDISEVSHSSQEYALLSEQSEQKSTSQFWEVIFVILWPSWIRDILKG